MRTFLAALWIAVAVALAAPAYAQADLTLGGDAAARIHWQRVFASAGNDWINDIVPLEDGFMAVGFLNRVDGDPPSDWRALAVLLDQEGATLSSNEYGAGGGIDAFWSLALGAGGSRAFAGFTTRVGLGGINGWALIARPDGTILRENGYGGGGYDRFTDVAAAEDGFVFLGHSQAEGEMVRRRVFIVKTDPAGLPLWERIVDGPDSYGALYIEPAGDGGFVIAGGIAAGEESDMLVLKVDSNGREQWRRSVGAAGTPDVNHGLAVRPDGSILIVGYSQSFGARDNDIMAATLSASGEIKRIAMFGGAGDDRPMLLKLGEDGRAWVVGRTTSAGAGEADLIVTGLDAKGDFDGGAITLGGSADDVGTAVFPLADSLLVSGYSLNLGRGGEDAFVARISKPGSKKHPAFEARIIQPGAKAK